MAKILNIEEKRENGRYILKYSLENKNIAEYLEASYLSPVRCESNGMVILYSRNSALFVDGPNKEAVEKIDSLLRDKIKKE